MQDIVKLSWIKISFTESEDDMDLYTKDKLIKLGTVGAALGAYGIYALSSRRKEKVDELVNDINKLVRSLDVERDGSHIERGGSYVMISTDVGHITITIHSRNVTISDCDNNETQIKVSDSSFMNKVVNAITMAYNNRYNSEIAKILGKGGDIIDVEEC